MAVYQLMVLDGLTFAYNPVKAPNPKVRVVAETPTLLGRTLTDWGTNPSRQDVMLSWPVMDCCFFADLEAKSLLGGMLAFSDDDATPYTVVALPPTFENKTPGGEGYMGVAMKLMVVSSP